MIKQNLHTHSTYCDGKDTLEEMILMAIEKNFTILGFSGHAYSPQDDVGMSKESQEQYRKEILTLKEKYKDQIEIFVGLEQDITYRTDHPEDYDYLIGSKHYMEHNGDCRGVDYSKEITQSMVDEWYKSFLVYAKEYYEGLKELAQWDEIDVVGHLDLLMKFNEDESFISFDDGEYLQYAYDAIDCLIEANKIFEVNTGAISRGYRSQPYPYKNLLEYIFKKGGRVILTSDCHNRNHLDCAYEETIELIQQCGFRTMEVLTSSGFASKPIKEFI